MTNDETTQTRATQLDTALTAAFAAVGDFLGEMELAYEDDLSEITLDIDHGAVYVSGFLVPSVSGSLPEYTLESGDNKLTVQRGEPFYLTLTQFGELVDKLA